MNRESVIVRTSVIGICANVFLAVLKTVIGLISGSIAVVLDAVNNLSDALSSLVTIIGTKLAGKAPDRKHPFGYGRIEYLSTMIIAVIVLYAGFTSLSESVQKLIHPQIPEYTPVSIFLVGAAVVVKILLGLFFQKKGKEVNSDSLVDSGKDAMMDSIISASTVLAAILYIVKGWKLEAVLGVVISVFILRSGIEMLKETISHLLGERSDSALASEIRSTILAFPEVSGVYDLTLNDYGPNKEIGSVHIEVPDYLTAEQIDVLTRNIQVALHEKHGIIISAVGIYAVNTKNDHAAEIEKNIREYIHSYDHILEVHGFHVDETSVRFDIVISFDEPDRYALYQKIINGIQEQYPGYMIQSTLDTDVSD